MPRLWITLLALPLTLGAENVREIFRNEKVAVTERIIPAASTTPLHRHPPGVVVAMADSASRRRGQVSFAEPQEHTAANPGATEVRNIRVDFLTAGRPGEAPWGAAGLSPNYKLLIENRYARVYEVRIPAGTKEPQHTHKDRVVVCLSGAQLEHLLPDGRTEPSTLQTNEVAWRRGGTHIGQNLGKTDLWVIAIEPK